MAGKMMKHVVSSLGCLTALMCSAAYAQSTVTAICSNPKGWSVGYETGKPQGGDDGFSGSTFTYSWKVTEKTATVISQNTLRGDGNPTTETASVVISQGFVTFVVMYERAVWIHTLYPSAEVVMISRHSDGRGPYEKSAAGGLFHARCKMSAI